MQHFYSLVSLSFKKKNASQKRERERETRNKCPTLLLTRLKTCSFVHFGIYVSFVNVCLKKAAFLHV